MTDDFFRYHLFHISRQDKPSKLRVYFGTELNAQEKALMQTYIYNLAPYSKYILERNNVDD